MNKRLRKSLVSRHWVAHLILIVWIGILVFPVYVAIIGSTHDAATIGGGRMPLVPGRHFLSNYVAAWQGGVGNRVIATPARVMMFNSLVMALGIAVGKIVVSLLSAYAIVYFRFPLRNFFFWLILITLMLPLEVRITPTYAVASSLGLVNTYAGLILPLMVSATGTLLFRQAFRTIPGELLDAAKIDGAGPLRCLLSVVLPLVRPNIAALFVVLFIYGWNQYLWPLLMTTHKQMETVVIGIVKMLGGPEALVDWNVVMANAVLAMMVPVIVVIVMQRWLVRGLVDTDK